MISALYTAYKSFRWRPHCKPGVHVLACRLAMPIVGSQVGYCDPGNEG